MTSSVKSDILERFAEAMFSYTAYPNDAQRSAVTQALVEKRQVWCTSLNWLISWEPMEPAFILFSIAFQLWILL